MSLSLYQYSQLCIIVETMVCSLCLLHIGNAKIKESSWIKQVKWYMAAVLFQVSVITAVQYAFSMSVTHPREDTALNITMLYLSTILLSMAFLPLASESHITRTRLSITIAVFLFCDALAWLSTFVGDSLSSILIVASLAVYLFELVRVSLVFMVNYRVLKSRERITGSDEDTRMSYLDVLARCVVLLSLFALLYIFLVLLSPQARAFHNFAMLITWAYMFVSFVNVLINYNPSIEESVAKNTENQRIVDSSAPHLPSVIESKIEAWVGEKSYCQQGVTMNQLAALLGSNRTYLSQFINSRYGCNFNAWLNKLRIDEAKRMMLESPTLSLDKVALAVGFASKSHFMSSFKSMEGITPGQWREKHS